MTNGLQKEDKIMIRKNKNEDGLNNVQTYIINTSNKPIRKLHNKLTVIDSTSRINLTRFDTTRTRPSSTHLEK